jgi:transcriptional regulator with XRE-family HTH domain
VRIEIGKRLREFRLAKGISVADLEARTGIPQDRIAAVEEGTETPTLDALEAWAGALGVGMHELFLSCESRSPEQQEGVGRLSAREKKLVRLFRSLTPEDQRDLLFVGKKMAGLGSREEGS